MIETKSQRYVLVYLTKEPCCRRYLALLIIGSVINSARLYGLISNAKEGIYHRSFSKVREIITQQSGSSEIGPVDCHSGLALCIP